MSFAAQIKLNCRDVFKRSSERNKPLDGIRALSSFLVVIFHSWMGIAFLGKDIFENFNAQLPTALLWITKTDLSVDAFFVLSGFLIGSILIRELDKSQTIDLKTFYLKRLFRLYPPYLLLILLVAIGLVLMPDNDKPLGNLIYNVFYISNFLPSEEMHIPWSWTLCVEEQFYIVIPLLLLLFYKRQPGMLWVLGSLYLLSYVIRWLVIYQHPQLATGEYTLKPFEMFENHDMLYVDALDNNLHTRYGAILTGVIGAYLANYHANRLAAIFQRSILTSTVILTFALLCIVLTSLAPTYRPSFYNQEPVLFNIINLTAGRNIFALGIMLLIFCMMHPLGIARGFSRFFGHSFWFPFAQLSYSTYLFHLPFVIVALSIQNQLLAPEDISAQHILIVAVVSFLVSSLFAFLVFITVERPFMLLRDRLYQPSTSKASTPIPPAVAN